MPMNEIDHNSHYNNKNTYKGHLILSNNMSNTAVLNENNNKFNLNKMNKLSNPNNQNMENNALTSSESMS